MNELRVVTDELGPLVGSERDLHAFYYALKQVTRRLQPGVVGALHATCSDEASIETVEAFNSGFARDLLPPLKHAHRAPFATSSLGGRYEWGSLRVAEDHFALPESARSFKLMLVKVSAHVGVLPGPHEPAFGSMLRYGMESTCCGMLTALLGGTELPSAEPLREVFGSEGVDRLAMLREDVEPRVRLLAAAIVSARLQARSAVLEAQDHTAATPTLYLIVPTVTLNKPDRDAELLCGVYLLDRRHGREEDHYLGLGDLPAAYRIGEEQGRLRVTDGSAITPRAARDHRRMIREARDEMAAPLARDGRVDELLERARSEALDDHALNVLLLEGLLLALAELSPVSAALLLFGEGSVSVYKAYQAHRMVREVEASDEARAILEDLHRQVESMPPEDVERVLRILLEEYEGQA